MAPPMDKYKSRRWQVHLAGVLCIKEDQQYIKRKENVIKSSGYLSYCQIL